MYRSTGEKQRKFSVKNVAKLKHFRNWSAVKNALVHLVKFI